MDEMCPGITGLKLDTAKIRVDYLVKRMLTVPDHDELTSTTCLRSITERFRVVVENLGSIGIESLRSEGMLNTKFLLETIESRPDALERHA